MMLCCSISRKKALKRHINDDYIQAMIIDEEELPVHDGPSIYANYLSPRSGRPLTIDQFRIYLDALKHLGSLHTGEDRSDAKARFSCGGLSLGEQFRLWYHAFHNPDMDEEDYFELDTLEELILNGRSSDQHQQREEVVDPFRLSASAKSAIGQYIGVWEGQLKDLPNEVIYVALPPEIGWSIDTPRRLQDYRDLKNKQICPLFLVNRILLDLIFPELDFPNYQTSVFEIWDRETVGIAESLASHLTGSYVKYGGTNDYNAGVSIESATSDQYDDIWESIDVQHENDPSFLKAMIQRMKYEGQRVADHMTTMAENQVEEEKEAVVEEVGELMTTLETQVEATKEDYKQIIPVAETVVTFLDDLDRLSKTMQ